MKCKIQNDGIRVSFYIKKKNGEWNGSEKAEIEKYETHWHRSPLWMKMMSMWTHIISIICSFISRFGYMSCENEFLKSHNRSDNWITEYIC